MRELLRSGCMCAYAPRTHAHGHAQAYLLFGEQEDLDMFVAASAAALRHMRGPRGAARSVPGFLKDVAMESGRQVRSTLWSLSAHWPGMMAVIGAVTLL